MTIILFSILCSTGILILFKLISQYKVVTSHTILISYAVSALSGWFILPTSFSNFQSIWIVVAAFEGVAFYAVFHLMARSTALSGITFTGLASKMSVVIPISVGLLFLSETGSGLIFTGILLGLVAVVLTIEKSDESSNELSSAWIWPVLVFVGTGLIDASFKMFQVWGLHENQFPAFIIFIFSFAFVTGILRYIFADRSRIVSNSVLAGLVLGLLNLGTVYFLMRALAIPSLQSTLVYALNSFGIVLMSMLVAIGLFRERVSKKGYVGIAMAVTSILFLYLAHTQ